ncbi:MAG TPA: phytanoyl-CoA dioxygenase family protein [Acidimicrobiales bacterium]|nr:phytanoyl-CoA dioxygenase family protein [Acidimicrobiales bacterium]
MSTTLDFDHFHQDLETRARSAHRLAGQPAALAPIAFRLPDGRAYTVGADTAAFWVRAGVDDAATIVDLSEADWHAFAIERFTRYGLLFNGRLSFARGAFEDLCHWEPPLRALFHGRPVYEPQSIVFTDRLGGALDLSQSFTLDDASLDRAHFLQSTGFLHVRNMFSAGEIAELRAEVTRLARSSTSDDVTTWWTKAADGQPAVCQVKYGAQHSSLITALHDDPRVRALLADGGRDDLLPNLDRNEGTKIIFKHPGASEGMTDLPLHTDCGMGFHPVACPMVLIGIHLDRGDERSGQLHVAAGSHLSTTPDPAIVDTSSWPIVALTTEAGDCTVHFSHTLHGAPSPRGGLAAGEHGRRTIYACFAPPSLFAALQPYEDLVAVMQRSDGVTMTVDEKLAKM